MLKVFRDNLKYLSWVLWLVILVFVLFVFVDFGATVPGGGSILSDAAATVGNEKVTFAEFEDSYRRTEDFYRQAYGEQFNRELAQQMGLPLQVMDGLIADKILLAEADRMGLRVTDDEVAETISEMAAFKLPDGRFVGEDRYREILRSSRFTVDQFETSVRSDLLGEKVRNVLSDNLYVSDEEVVSSYRDRVETAKIRYLRLPVDSLRGEIELSDTELEEYFSAHQEDFRFSERRVVDYLLLNPDELRAEIEIAEQEVRDYYDSNPDEFTQEEQVKARHILLSVGGDRTAEEAEQTLQDARVRIEAGEDFAVLAAEISDDPGSKDRGGDLGFFGRGQMIREFEEASFAAQPGDLVGPVETSFGVHLIEVQEKRPGGVRPYDEVSDQIQSRLLSERSEGLAETQIQELAKRIAGENLEGPDQLRQLAESEAGVTFHTTPSFSQDQNVPGIGRGTKFSSTAFELEPETLSEPLQVARGWTILRLGEIQEPRIPSLDEVRDEVNNALADERQFELAKEKLSGVRQAMEAGATLEDAGAEIDLSVTETSEFRRGGSIQGLGTSPRIAASALALDVGEIDGPIVNNRDVVLFEINERTHYDPAELEKEMVEARDSLREERLNQVLTSLIAQRRDQMGVGYDDQFLVNFELSPTS